MATGGRGKGGIRRPPPVKKLATNVRFVGEASAEPFFILLLTASAFRGRPIVLLERELTFKLTRVPVTTLLALVVVL